MPIIFNGTEIEKVIYDGVELNSVVYNGVEIYSASQEPETFVFTGLDIDGNTTTDETQIVSYMIGDGSSNYGNGYNGTETNVVIPATYNNKPVTKIGAYAFREKILITSVELPVGIIEIESFAFDSCIGLTEINLPSSLTKIGQYAFSNCTNLTSIEIPENITSLKRNTFAYCENLQNIKLNFGLLEIGEGAFTHVFANTNIIIPESVVTIGTDAFYGNIGLTSVEIPLSVTSIGSGAFAYCQNLTEMTMLPTTPPTLVNSSAISTATTTIYVPYESLEAYKTATNWSSFASIMVAFGEPEEIEPFVYTGLDSDGATTTDETAIVAYMIGNNTTTNGNGYNGTEESVEIPSTYKNKPVTKIGQYAFAGNTNVKSVEIPDSIVEIGNLAFMGTELSTVHIPSSIELMGDNPFAYCKKLQSITSDNIGALGSTSGYYTILTPTAQDTTRKLYYGKTLVAYASYGDTVFGEAGTLGISTHGFGNYCCAGSLLTEVYFEHSTTIGNHAFEDCLGLSSINFPTYISYIGQYAFKGCSNLRSFTIADRTSALSLGTGVFEQCSSLTSATINSPIKTIPSQAFLGCSSLSYVDIDDNVSNIGGQAFEGCSALTQIVLPSALTIINPALFKNAGLTSIELLDSVRYIYDEAFAGCPLESMTVKSTTPPTLRSSAIPLTISRIAVPSSSVDTYKSASVWQNYSSVIVGGVVVSSWKTVWTGSVLFAQAFAAYAKVSKEIVGVVAGRPTRVSGRATSAGTAFSNVELNYNDTETGTFIVGDTNNQYMFAPTTNNTLVARVKGNLAMRGITLTEVQQYY